VLPPLSKPLRTPRLTLRVVQARDLGALMAVNGDAAVTRYLPYAPWQTLADARAWLARTRSLEADGTAQQWVVALRRPPAGREAVIGTLLFHRHEPRADRVELGYVLGRRYWGQGLMREAVAAACTHAFSAWHVHRIEAEVQPANDASCRLLEAVGFVREGVLRGRWGGASQPLDMVMHALLANDAAAPAIERRIVPGRAVRPRACLPQNNLGESTMSVAKVIEIIATSKTGFEDAIKQGVARATDSVSDVAGAWVKDQSVSITSGKITEYRVTMKVTFVLRDAAPKGKGKSK
jgi:[ribosomal protein S5]-alanine N-acetyltransferase